MQKRMHYAWAICIGCTLMIFMTAGLCGNSFSVALPLILEKNHFTNTQTTLINTTRSATYLLSMLLIPLYYHKLGYRLGTGLALGLCTLSFVIYANATSLFHYYCGAAVSGIGSSLAGMVPATILINRWFNERRGLALGLCTASSGLATVIFSPVLSSIIQNSSLKSGFLFCALLCFIVCVLLFLLIRDDPSSCNMTPFGHAINYRNMKINKPAVQLSRRRWFCVYLFAGLLGCCVNIGFASIAISVSNAGFSASTASLALSFAGFALMAGKLVFGSLCDKFGAYRSNYLLGGLLLIGSLMMVFLKYFSIPVMLLGTLIFGAGSCLQTTGFAIWTTDFSSPELLERHVQKLNVSFSAVSLAFSVIPGVLADLTGSYAPGYFIMFLFALSGLIVVQSTYRLPQFHNRKES